MATYRAREPIYLNNAGRLVDTGEVFSSDEVPGLAWEPVIEQPQAEAAGRVARKATAPDA
jgi:hypothetical protein